MKQEALIAWTSLYIGVGMMALICAVLAIVVTADDWRSGRWRPTHQTGLQKALVIPKLWLRWQLNSEQLEPGSSRGVSNEMIAAEAVIQIESGVLLTIQPAPIESIR